jgi:cyclic beta-1,2-glucan synthetase
VESLLRWIESLHSDCELLFPWIRHVPELSKSSAKDLVQFLEERPTLTGVLEAAAAARPRIEALRQRLASKKMHAGDRQANDASLDSLLSSLETGRQAAQELIGRLDRLGRQMEQLALAMDFRFLYNPRRRLFSIGFNLEDEKLDRSHYDMLCSEARLASYLAIAKGDAEPRHWFQLGRQLTQVAGQTVLLSWGGTMFEYLMPPLFQHDYEGSLLCQSCRGAVARQQQYGREHGVPWGISESAFGALAVNSDYHYRSFGVPRLGLKRGLGEDLVVSPYSTMLALEIDPHAATQNLHDLVREGALGPWGMYDALDYTPQRVPPGKRSIVVRCYMTHHQGMSLLALANLLEQGSIRRRFNAHPLPRSTELLLQERIPAAAPLIEPHAGEAAAIEVPTPD